MKHIVLKRVNSSDELKVTDLIGACSIGGTKVLVGEQLLIEDLGFLVRLGFSITLIQHENPTPNTSPLRGQWK